MEYKIYHTAIQFSKPPYVLENMKVDINLFHQMWKSDETKWEYIGSVPTLEIARCLVEQDKQFVIINNKKYELNCEPSDECYYEFVKIESDDFVVMTVIMRIIMLCLRGEMYEFKRISES